MSQLESKTTAQLKEMCKERGLQISTHGRRFTKAELIEQLKGVEEASEEVEQLDEGSRESYIEAAEVGTLVAFKAPKRKKGIDTAKIINRSSKRRVLKVENKQGEVSTITYEDVLWVNTNGRWPRHIYEMLTKGRKERDGKTEDR